MRSIGKSNIEIVKRVTKEVINSGNIANSDVEDVVVKMLPEKMWDTWESADSEIRRIISDVVFEKVVRNKW